LENKPESEELKKIRKRLEGLLDCGFSTGTNPF